MNLSVFLELIEFKAKAASVFPFLLGLFFTAYHFGWNSIDPLNMLIFFAAMFIFNMSVDINDNYQDFHRAKRNKAEQFRLKTNVIGVNKLNIHMIGRLLFSFIAISALLGIFLVFRSSWLLLVMGLFCFAVGYFYAAGKTPISALPIGEFFSGFTMGFMIFFITVFLNLANKGLMSVQVLWQSFLAAGLSTFAISALLLANNICDQKEDLQLKRRTVVYYIGTKKALIAFDSFYILGYLCLIIAVALSALPFLSLLSLLSIPIVWKNVIKFNKKQVKKETFQLAVKNLIISSLFQTIALFLGLIFHF
ncbi:1,4-dihydroxy-2-naphthoate polyprenyltransferase [Oenococcus alcoholitolerans]|uniref:1,4-dihydroxy-2-naphthoate polyprenyltransferase n=1 Tax=Oenococcus alcoholitolerans TaxID=931074 RepID=UPI003F7268D7